MEYLKPAVTALILLSALAAVKVAAQQQPVVPPIVTEGYRPTLTPPPRPAPAAKPAQQQPAAAPVVTQGYRPAPPPPLNPAPNNEPAARRSVQQIIETMPAKPPVVTDSERPSLTPPPVAPSPSLTPPPVAPSPNPPPPAQVNSCDAGGCTDVNGARYNSGVGDASVSGQGRLCNRSGTTVQCF
jgi:hypothetical protein